MVFLWFVGFDEWVCGLGVASVCLRWACCYCWLGFLVCLTVDYLFCGFCLSVLVFRWRLVG